MSCLQEVIWSLVGLSYVLSFFIMRNWWKNNTNDFRGFEKEAVGALWIVSPIVIFCVFANYSYYYFEKLFKFIFKQIGIFVTGSD